MTKEKIFKYLGNPFAVSVFFIIVIMAITYIHFKDTEATTNTYVSMAIYVGVSSFIIMWMNYYITKESAKKYQLDNKTNSTFDIVNGEGPDLRDPMHQNLMRSQQEFGTYGGAPPPPELAQHSYGSAPRPPPSYPPRPPSSYPQPPPSHSSRDSAHQSLHRAPALAPAPAPAPAVGLGQYVQQKNNNYAQSTVGGGSIASARPPVNLQGLGLGPR